MKTTGANDDDEPTDPGIPSQIHRRAPPDLLRDLDQQPGAYRALLAACDGDLIRAAHRLAEARLLVAAQVWPPSVRDVLAACRLMHDRLGSVDPAPAPITVIAACRRHGLPLAGHD